jgi:hypothetical protein
MTPEQFPKIDDVGDVVWYVKYFWHLIGGATGILGFFIWLFRESIKQILIDWNVKRLKMREAKIVKGIKELENGGPNPTGTGGSTASPRTDDKTDD